MVEIAAEETTKATLIEDRRVETDGLHWFERLLGQVEEDCFDGSPASNRTSEERSFSAPLAEWENDPAVKNTLADLAETRDVIAEELKALAFRGNVPFEITDSEWKNLQNELGKLCYYAAWKVAGSNGVERSNEAVDDLIQNCLEALIRAAMYFKRMAFVDQAIQYIIANIEKVPAVIFPLIDYDIVHRWGSRRVLSGNRGFKTREIELILILKLMSHDDPKNVPDHRAELKITQYFKAYAKTIIWNAAKTDGAQIAEEKKRAANSVSIDACGWFAIDTSDGMNELMSREQLEAIGTELKKLPDQRPFQVFDVLAHDPEAFDENNGNVVRKTVKHRYGVGYATIRKSMTAIREVIEMTGGVDHVLVKGGVCGRNVSKENVFLADRD